MKKKNFIKTTAMLGVIAVLTLGQSLNALAAQSYVYSAERGKGDDPPSVNTITSYLIGRMNTTFSACLGIQVNGIYTVRGSDKRVAEGGKDFYKRSLDTQVSAMATYTVTVDSHIYYCGVRCVGYYSYSPSSAVYVFPMQDIDV